MAAGDALPGALGAMSFTGASMVVCRPLGTGVRIVSEVSRGV